MTRRLRVLATVAAGGIGLAALAGGVLVATAAGEEEDAAALSRLTAIGRPYDLPAGDARTERLEEAGLKAVTLLSSRDGRSFFRLDYASGRSCWAMGDAARSWPLGGITCRIAEPWFPSRELPVLDDSVAEQDGARGDPAPHLTRLQGFAVDGVAEISVRDAAGRELVRVPVVSNTYVAQNLPRTAAYAVAFGSDGRKIVEIP
jgi:hypothetical protein